MNEPRAKSSTIGELGSDKIKDSPSVVELNEAEAVLFQEREGRKKSSLLRSPETPGGSTRLGLVADSDSLRGSFEWKQSQPKPVLNFRLNSSFEADSIKNKMNDPVKSTPNNTTNSRKKV